MGGSIEKRKKEPASNQLLPLHTKKEGRDKKRKVRREKPCCPAKKARKFGAEGPDQGPFFGDYDKSMLSKK